MSASKLSRELKRLIGETVWDIGVVPAAGADFTLDAGEKWRVPSKGRRGYQEQGRLTLYVICSWRLEQAQTIVLSSADLLKRDNGWAEGLEVLIGRTVRGVVVRDAARSVKISFDDGHDLFIFADRARKGERANYSFSPTTSEKYWLVAGGAVELEPRFSPEKFDKLERVT